MSNMLGGISVKDLRGPMTDFLSRLEGDDGSQWLSAFKRFLRKENPWTTATNGTPSPSGGEKAAATFKNTTDYFLAARKRTESINTRRVLAGYQQFAYSKTTGDLEKFRLRYTPESFTEHFEKERTSGSYDMPKMDVEQSKYMEALWAAEKEAMKLLEEIGLWS